ncbi:MAG TPA: ABC transporter permease, partial [Candidatus Dormibacteraeota bacterium]|nr:ABC transporter permease [Candidatus Dormibacteraeota bacterium]
MPEWKREIRALLASLRLDPGRQEEIAEEVAQHLEQRYEELRRSGAADEEAARVAREELAATEVLADSLRRQERAAAPAAPILGSTASGGWLPALWSDVRFGVRTLGRSPGLTAVALLTLALGIGANAVIFSAVNAILLRPLPFPDPGRLVSFWGSAPDKGLPVVNYPDAFYTHFHTRSRTLDPIAAYSIAGFTLVGAGDPERLTGAYVTVDFFRLLGGVPLQGRAFLPGEDARDAAPVAILSHGLWQRRFDGDPGIVGKAVTLDHVSGTVVGIMPPGFDFPNRAELWVPLHIDPQALNCWCYAMIGRLAQRLTPADAAREIAALSDQFWQEWEPGKPRQGKSIAVAVPLARDLVGEVRTPILVLFGAVSMVLLIACANIANLLLARATARGREIAVRCCLGATPWRIVRQLLVESLLLALAGAAIGLALATWGISALGRVAVERLPHIHHLGLDPVVLLFTLGV